MGSKMDHSTTSITVVTVLLEQLCLFIRNALTDKRGKTEIPDSIIREIAMCLLPAVIEFFSSEEAMAEYEAWQKAQSEHEAKTSKA